MMKEITEKFLEQQISKQNIKSFVPGEYFFTGTFVKPLYFVFSEFCIASSAAYKYLEELSPKGQKTSSVTIPRSFFRSYTGAPCDFINKIPSSFLNIDGHFMDGSIVFQKENSSYFVYADSQIPYNIDIRFFNSDEVLIEKINVSEKPKKYILDNAKNWDYMEITKSSYSKPKG